MAGMTTWTMLMGLAFAPPAGGSPAPTATAEPPADDASPISELTGSGPEDAPAPRPEGPVPAVPAASDSERAPGPGEGPGSATAATPAPAPGPTPTVTRKREPRTWPDRPIRYRIEAAMAGGTGVMFHPSYLGFDDDRKLPGFDAAVRLDYRAGDGRVFLGGGLFYRRFASTGHVFDAVDGDEIVLHEPGLALRLAVMTVEGIDVYAELAGAPTIMDISMNYEGTGSSAAQRKVTGMGSGMGGLMLYLPKRWLPRKGSSRVTLGIDAGLGYAFRGNVAVQPTPDVEDDAIGTQTAPLGDVVTRGLTWRMGVFLRLM